MATIPRTLLLLAVMLVAVTAFPLDKITNNSDTKAVPKPVELCPSLWMRSALSGVQTPGTIHTASVCSRGVSISESQWKPDHLHHLYVPRRPEKVLQGNLQSGPGMLRLPQSEEGRTVLLRRMLLLWCQRIIG